MLVRAENSVLAILRTGPMAAHLRTIDSLESLDEQMQARADVRSVQVRTPAAYVTSVGARLDDTTAQVRVAVLIVAANRARAIDRVDRTSAGSVSALADLAVQALDGATALDIVWMARSVDPVENEMFRAAGLGLMSIELVAHVEREYAEIEGAAGSGITPFETFAAQLDIPPQVSAAEHAKWLAEPPDNSASSPDAQTHVSLEQ